MNARKYISSANRLKAPTTRDSQDVVQKDILGLLVVEEVRGVK